MILPTWLLECIDDVNDLSKELDSGDALAQRARTYSFGAAGWLQTIEAPGDRSHADLRATLARDCAVIPASVCRALAGRGHEDPVKFALLDVQRSRSAWVTAAARGLAPAAEIGKFLAELDGIREDLERMLPPGTTE